MRSDRIKKGLERVPHRALLYATGLTKEEMDRPFIGVATSFNDLVPGHIGMRTLERFIEKASGSLWRLLFLLNFFRLGFWRLHVFFFLKRKADVFKKIFRLFFAVSCCDHGNSHPKNVF